MKRQGDAMAKKIIVTGKPARRIEVTGNPKRRIEPEEFAAALGAEPVGEVHASSLDPLALAALGSELIKRLRSSGGRPALADATEICRVPLSAEDIKTLERIVTQLAESSGAKPSVGQLVSVIVRAHLQALKGSTRGNQKETAMPIAAGPLTKVGPDFRTATPSDWRTSFPDVRDIATVADCAQNLAEAKMPLMLREAA
jgi:hypothetical protein